MTKNHILNLSFFNKNPDRSLLGNIYITVLIVRLSPTKMSISRVCDHPRISLFAMIDHFPDLRCPGHAKDNLNLENNV